MRKRRDGAAIQPSSPATLHSRPAPPPASCSMALSLGRCVARGAPTQRRDAPRATSSAALRPPQQQQQQLQQQQQSHAARRAGAFAGAPVAASAAARRGMAARSTLRVRANSCAIPSPSTRFVAIWRCVAVPVAVSRPSRRDRLTRSRPGICSICTARSQHLHCAHSLHPAQSLYHSTASLCARPAAVAKSFVLTWSPGECATRQPGRLPQALPLLRISTTADDALNC